MWDFIFIYKLNIVLFVGSLIFLLFIINSVRKERIKEAYSLIWLSMGIIFLILSVWIKAYNYITNIFGIVYSPILFFLLLIVMILFILIQYSIVLSKQTEKIKTLVQESALLKRKLEEQDNRITNYELRITNLNAFNTEKIVTANKHK